VITKAVATHGDTYDYSLVKYVKMKDKVKIKCKTHGVFLQDMDSHIAGSGCKLCNKSNGSSIKYLHTKPAILYFIKIAPSCYKLGITTSRSVKQRYWGEGLNNLEILFQVSFFKASDAYIQEKYILNKFKKYKYTGDSMLNNTKITEMLSIDISEYLKRWDSSADAFAATSDLTELEEVLSTINNEL